MAHKIEGYGANRFGEYQFDVAPDENDGWQRATLVIGDERVFTESEVRAMLRAVRDGLEANCRWQAQIEVVSASAMRQAFRRKDVLSLDPA